MITESVKWTVYGVERCACFKTREQDGKTALDVRIDNGAWELHSLNLDETHAGAVGRRVLENIAANNGWW